MLLQHEIVCACVMSVCVHMVVVSVVVECV